MLNAMHRPLVFLLFLTLQNVATITRTGDVARQLTDEDIAGLQMNLQQGARPWLLNGDRVQQANVQFVGAFLPPNQVSPDLRKGPVVNMTRRIVPNLTAWMIHSTESYAQVAIEGRSFDQIAGDQDILRPFRVIGQFEDEELIRIVRFLRTNPSRSPNESPNESAVQSWPILSLNRQDNYSIRVMLRRDASSGQSADLLLLFNELRVVKVEFWQQ
jgi:hypothetical protein